MKRDIVLLLVGLVVGFGVGHFWPSSSPQEPAMVEPTKTEVDESDMLANEVNATPAPTPVEAEGTPTNVPEAPSTSETVAPTSVNFNSDLVSQLEHQWEDLPNQVRVVREEKGWRITFLQSGSLFSQTGLQQGDLITMQTLESFDARNDGEIEEEPLSDRLVNILNYVSTN